MAFPFRGKFAVVRKCVEKGTGHEYAAKFMRKRRKGQDCRTEIIHEIAVLELATASPRVVTLHQVYEMASEMVLVLEFAAGGEIFNQCVSEREDEAFSQEDVKRLMRQILEGVSFLHQNNIVHLDLKPQNILLTSSSPVGDIKIVDFGLSRRVSSHHELREIMGTPEFVAPEILNYEPISTATDMWSIGVLAYVMLTGFSPFLGEDKQETFLNISQLNLKAPPTPTPSWAVGGPGASTDPTEGVQQTQDRGQGSLDGSSFDWMPLQEQAWSKQKSTGRACVRVLARPGYANC
ncbi:unnamed protein product [Menidia menidia]|uniref:non-specific serine/threonine protein kinase n=1 Tax=Menidia menidia TaxID=238744 RepID=A0A8S4AT84_9TELE|nr:unnamed protein product [Menidia menidia]